MSSLASRIQGLGEELAHCDDDDRSLELVHELQQLLHLRLEELRDRLETVRFLARIEAEKAAAQFAETSKKQSPKSRPRRVLFLRSD